MQTSIEWLENKVKLMIEHNGCEDLLAVLQHIEQAKEMHKKEIVDAHHYGRAFENKYPDSLKTYNDSAEQYYNQTFNNA